MEEAFVHTSCGRILVRTAGSGPPLAFLHGATLDGTQWEPQIVHFASRFRCIAWDAPWHGASEHPAAPANFADMARALQEVLAALDATPAHLVGLSMGSVLAADFACRYPAALRSMVLIGAIVCKGDVSPIVDEALLDTLATSTENPFVASGMNGSVAPATLRERPPWFAHYVARQANADLRTYADILRDLLRLDLREALATLRIPALVLWGEHDLGATSREANETAARCLAGSRFLVVPDAGHFTNLENPAFVNREIGRFLASAAHAP